MGEDLHKEDEYFRKAYRQTEDEPSPAVWDKISAGLDDSDTVYHRGKFAAWKSIAAILVLLLGIALIYEGFFANKNAAASKAIVESKTPASNNNSASLDQSKKDNNTKLHQQEKLSANKDLFSNKSFADMQQAEQKLILSNNNFTQQGKLPADQTASSASQPLIKIQAVTKDSSNVVYNNADKLNNTDQLSINSTNELPTINDKQSEPELALNKSLSKEQKSKDFKPYFAITPYVSVDFTQYELDDDDHNPNNTLDDKQDIEGREMHQVSYSAGVLGKWQFSQKLSVKTGLVYSNIAIAIRPQTLYAEQENNQRTGYKFITSAGYAFVNPVFSTSPVIGDSINATLAHHHLQYLNVPLMVGYKIPAGKRISITPGIGLNASILLSTKVRTEVNEDTDTEMVVINKLQGLQKTYYSFAADAEFNYTLNKHIMLTALPMFKYALISITKNNVVRTYPYSIGLGAGVTYRF